jgi:putative addiction module CopG family antidote
MSVSIPSELGPFVDEMVATGTYPTPEAVVSEALRRWRDDRAKFEELKASFDEAVAELDRGEGKPLDFEEFRRKGRARLAAYRKQ